MPRRHASESMIGLADNVTKPIAGQKTGRQLIFGGAAFSGGIAPPGMLIGPNGDLGNNPLGELGVWPWWGGMLAGTYAVYRAMLRHPTIAYVAGQIVSAIAASSWTVDADSDAPEDAVAWVTENVLAHRATIVPHSLRALFLRSSPFEIVWRGKSKQWSIDQYVPLLPDWTSVLRGDGGNGPILGYQNGQAKLGLSECLFIRNTADLMGDEPGDDYGRSRLENIRDTAWAGWLEVMRQLAELEMRIAGIVPVITVPAGTASNGKTFAQNANEILPALCHPRSQGAVLESPGVGEVDAGTDPAKFKQLMTTVAPLDLGQRAQSQAQMLAKAEYYDKLIARGLMRGERSVFQGEHGNMADAQQHSENTEPDAEAIDNMIASQVNDGPVRTGLLLHWGPEVLNKVRGIKPAPLVDKERQAAAGWINTMLQNTATAELMLAFFNGTSLFSQAGAPTSKDVTWDQIVQAALATHAQPSTSGGATGNDEPIEASDSKRIGMNGSALQHAHSLIDAGAVDDGPWSFADADGDALLGENDWSAYGRNFLGVHGQAQKLTRDRYAFPFAKLVDGKVRIFKSALVEITGDAKSEGAPAVASAAAKLLLRINGVKPLQMADPGPGVSWVTINGIHVLIRGNRIQKAADESLVGKKIHQVPTSTPSIDEHLKRLADEAASPSGQNRTVPFAVLTPYDSAKVESAYGENVTGYARTIDTAHVIHALKPPTRKDELPVTHEDISALPEILAHPDQVKRSAQSGAMDAVRVKYRKQMPSGHVFVVDEQQAGPRELRIVSIAKMKASSK